MKEGKMGKCGIRSDGFSLPVPIVPIGRLSSTFTKKEETTTMNRICIYKLIIT